MNRMLKIPEAARLIGVSYSHLDRAINAGELPVSRPHAHRLVSEADLTRWLEDATTRQRKQATP